MNNFFVTFIETGLAYFRVKNERLSDSNAYTPVTNREQNISVNLLLLFDLYMTFEIGALQTVCMLTVAF